MIWGKLMLYKCFFLKTVFVVFILLTFHSGVIRVPVFGQENSNAGFELLLNALEKQGDNPSVIHTGIIDVVITKNKKIDEEEYKKALQSLKKEYADRLATTSKDSKRYAQLSSSLKTVDIDYRGVYLRRHSTKELYRITFRGTPPYSDVKQEIFELTSMKEQVPNEVNPVMVVIGNNVDRFRRSMYLWHREGSGNNVIIESNYGVPFVNQLGKIRSPMFTMLTAALLYGGTKKQLNDFEFNKETVNTWRDSNHKLLQKDKEAAVHIFEKKDTPEGMIYGVIMPGLSLNSAGLQGTSRFPKKIIVWINPEKGYITPLIEEYSGDICVKRYESQDYFLEENSEIWYPKKSIDTEFDAKGEQISQTTYEVSEEKSAINIKISDDEFVFPVSAGWTVTDRQSGRQNSYRAVRNTKLKFENGRITLRGNRDFISESNALSVNLPVNNDWLIRMFCIVIGVIFVLFTLFRLRRSNKN
jgi:hypothetical protein